MPEYNRCDGHNDCVDNSDEVGCDSSDGAGMYNLHVCTVYKCIKMFNVCQKLLQ